MKRDGCLLRTRRARPCVSDITSDHVIREQGVIHPIDLPPPTCSMCLITTLKASLTTLILGAALVLSHPKPGYAAGPDCSVIEARPYADPNGGDCDGISFLVVCTGCISCDVDANSCSDVMYADCGASGCLMA